MANDPIMNIVSRQIEAKSIRFANLSNKKMIEIDDYIDSIGDAMDINATIQDTGVVQSVVDNYYTSVENEIRELINQLAQIGYDDATLGDAKQDDLYIWELGNNHRHCSDCSDRNGRVETMDVWEAIGKPSDGCTICGGWCHCTLTKKM